MHDFSSAQQEADGTTSCPAQLFRGMVLASRLLAASSAVQSSAGVSVSLMLLEVNVAHDARCCELLSPAY